MDTEGNLAEEAFLKAPDRTALALEVASFPAVLAVASCRVGPEGITFAEGASVVASYRVDPEDIAFVVEGTTFAVKDTEASMAMDIDPFKAKDIAPSEAGDIGPFEARGTDPSVAEDSPFMVVGIAPFEAEDILAVVDINLAILQGHLDPFLEDKRLH